MLKGVGGAKAKGILCLIAIMCNNGTSFHYSVQFRGKVCVLHSLSVEHAFGLQFRGRIKIKLKGNQMPFKVTEPHLFLIKARLNF